MRLRTDLSDLMISLSSFQSFDHGQEIEESVPEEWNLLSGDIINWYCGQFYGTVEVVRRNDEGGRHICVLKKIS